MSAWGDSFGDAWGDAWGEESAPEATVDGAGIRAARRRQRYFTKRTPEDIRREQLEDERYLASLEKPQPVDPTEGDVPQANADPEVFARPAAHPVLVDVAARAASAVQDKIEEAEKAAALDLAKQQRRHTLALLLALD